MNRSVQRICAAVSLMMFLTFWRVALAQNNGPVAQWKFDEGSGQTALNSASGNRDRILNNHDWVRGISGTALKFDGLSTAVASPPQNVPRLGASFSIEAWIAIQSYPWNWVAIVDQEDKRSSGYYFGVDSEGRLGLGLEVWGNGEEIASTVRLPLMKWVHVAGTFDADTGIKLFVDGKIAGQLPVKGRMTPTKGTGLMIGRNFNRLPPTSLVRAFARFPASYSFDGIIDDLKIYDRTIDPEAIQKAFLSVSPTAPPLKARRWPVIPAGPDDFGAVYCRLKLYPEWDALWRSGPYSDVVVRFKDLPFHYAFWRGTNFEENLVTENGIWMGDQSFESGTQNGTAEHMNDKQCVHQHSSAERSTSRPPLAIRVGGCAGQLLSY